METPSESEPVSEPEPIDPNYEKPSCDVIIGKNGDSPQFGIIGKMNSNGRVIGLDLNECNTISLFGVQGAGKSYTIGSITEMVLRQFSKVNLLPAPMASVIFHYSDCRLSEPKPNIAWIMHLNSHLWYIQMMKPVN